MAYRELSSPTLRFRDFAPAYAKSRVIGELGLCDDIGSAVEAANQWIREHQIRVINVETVILPEMHQRGGSDQGQLWGTNPVWFQFVRVWFRTES